MRVPGAARQSYSFGKIHPHFADRMSIRGESYRHADLRSHLDDLRAGIDLSTIFSQTGGVKLHRYALFLRRFQKAPEERSAITVGIKAKLFAQVGMSDDFEES